MSKETINYQCGHTGTVNLVGNSKDRARRAKWIGENRVCPKCEAEQFATHNAAAAAANASAGLPALEGTEKQIAWAESIRKERIAEMETGGKIANLQRRYNAAQSEGEKQSIIREDEKAGRDLSYHVQEALSNLRTPERYDACMIFLKSQTDASWWIEWHRTSMAHIINQHAKRIDECEYDARSVPAEIQEAAQAEIAESTLKPAGDPVSQTSAEIKSTGDAIEVHFPEKRDDFRELVKTLGYCWDGSCWRKTLGIMTGDATDRLAEVAHRLVAAGFIVRLHDAQARERAIIGQFEPEIMRWIYKISDGKYAGWLGIKWGRNDDMYNIARSLPGARYVKPRLIVPAGAVEACVEFAERYGFSMTAGALAILQEHRSALAGGAVITNIKERPVAPVAPVAPFAPTNAAIDDSLRD